MLFRSTLIVYYLYLLPFQVMHSNHSSISTHVIFLLVLQYGNQLRLLLSDPGSDLYSGSDLYPGSDLYLASPPEIEESILV